MSAGRGAAPRLAQEEEAELLCEGLEGLSGREPLLVARFYELFFERHPEVRGLFGVHGLSEQEEMVRETLVSVVAYIEREPWLEINLEAMGKSHSEYGVEAPMYDWFVECMLDALKQVSGTGWRVDYDPAWRSALGLLTDIMRAAGARA